MLALSWVARQIALRRSKTPFLVDAKAALGTVTKGGSSARALRTLLRGAAARALAANILPRLLLLPCCTGLATDALLRGTGHRAL